MPDPYWASVGAKVAEEHRRGTKEFRRQRYGMVRKECPRCGRVFMLGWDTARTGRQKECPKCRKKR